MPSRIPIFRSLPEDVRARIGMRRGRRWATSVVYNGRHNRAQAAGAPLISFYPMRPGPKSSMAYVLPRLGARIGHSPRAEGLLFAWDTGTHFSARALRRLRAGAVNRYCIDISKSNVDRVWSLVAGYSISVDPLTTHGPLVEKPEMNGLHAGRVIDGPLPARRHGMVYQRLVDSRVEDGRILHLRPVFIGAKIILTYAKWREHPDWFVGTEVTVPEATDELLSASEQELLVRFTGTIGLEYGELDVLRDRHTGLIYVVDANRTPVRPKGLPTESDDAAFGPQAEALAELIRR